MVRIIFTLTQTCMPRCHVLSVPWLRGHEIARLRRLQLWSLRASCDFEGNGEGDPKNRAIVVIPPPDQQDTKEYLNQRGTSIGVFRESKKGGERGR